jgi:hypothetical protein
MIRRKWLVAVLVAFPTTFIGVACYNEATPVKTLNSSDRDENGWPLYRNQEAGFAIALPPTWQKTEMDPAKYEAILRDAQRYNPELRYFMARDRAQGAASELKFLGVETASVNTSFTTNVTVTRTRYPVKYTLDQMVAIYSNDMEGSEMVLTKPVFHERTQIAAGDAERWRFTMVADGPGGQTSRFENAQFTFMKGYDCFEVSMVAIPERYVNLEATFLKIGKSFRLIQ